MTINRQIIDNLASQEKEWVSISETVRVCTRDLMPVPLGLKSNNQCGYKNHQVTHTAAPFASDWLGRRMQPLRLLRHCWRPLTSAPSNLPDTATTVVAGFAHFTLRSQNGSALAFHTMPELVRCGLVNDHEYVGFPSLLSPMWIWCHLVQSRYKVVIKKMFKVSIYQANVGTARRLIADKIKTLDKMATNDW